MVGRDDEEGCKFLELGLGVVLHVFHGGYKNGSQQQEEQCLGYGGGASNRQRPKNWKWEKQKLDATLGTNPEQSSETNRGGTSQMGQLFWENLTKFMGSAIGAMLQEQQIQKHPAETPSAQAVRRELYSD